MQHLSFLPIVILKGIYAKKQFSCSTSCYQLSLSDSELTISDTNTVPHSRFTTTTTTTAGSRYTTRHVLTSLLAAEEDEAKYPSLIQSELEKLNVQPGSLYSLLDAVQKNTLDFLWPDAKLLRILEPFMVDEKLHFFIAQQEHARPGFTLVYVPAREFMQMEACPFLSHHR